MRNAIALLCVMMLGGLFGCTRESSPPSSYGAGNNNAGAGTSFGNLNGSAFPTFVDVQDAMTQEVSENDNVVETDFAGKDLSADADISCTGPEVYCTCMLSYDDEEFCTCEEEHPTPTDVFCECTLKVCVANPDPDMAVQFSTICASLYPDECEGF